MGNTVPCLKTVWPENVAREYDIKGKLGSGQCSVVRRVLQKNGQKSFAMKIVERSKLVDQEIKIMKKIKNPHIVNLKTVFYSDEKVYMILDLLDGGSLYSRIIERGNYDEVEARGIFKEISLGVQYLHFSGIVHRDLKLENLLFSDPTAKAAIKITDFGFSTELKSSLNRNEVSQKLTTLCGSPGYVAPEILKNEPYDEKVDMWSLGVILYIILCGFPPFYHEHTRVLYNQIKKGEVVFAEPWWTGISAQAILLIKELLNVKPKKRISAKRVLFHRWIRNSKYLQKDVAMGGLKSLRLVMRVIIIVNRIVRHARRSNIHPVRGKSIFFGMKKMDEI